MPPGGAKAHNRAKMWLQPSKSLKGLSQPLAGVSGDLWGVPILPELYPELGYYSSIEYGQVSEGPNLRNDEEFDCPPIRMSAHT